MITVSNLVYLPLQVFEENDLRKALTIKYSTMGSKEVITVPAYVRRRTTVGVPRAYGLQLISKLGMPYRDDRSDGRKVRYPQHVEHTGAYAYQEKFVEEIVEACESEGDFLVHAATGKGKTVCALSTIQKLGRNAVIVVDQDNLKNQWIEQAKKVLGLKDEDIGVVQGPRCDYEGKKIVIAMIQTLTRRGVPEGMQDYFGVAVFDEVHTTGAATFSEALMMFSAKVRFGVSATVDRRDALQKLIHFNLGEVAVRLLDTHDKSYVYYVESDTVYSWYATVSPKTGRILSEVMEDTKRNCLVASAIKMLYDSGRDVLALSDRIEQLEVIRVLCAGEGIPVADIGMYCGKRSVWGFAKDSKPTRRPEGYEQGTEYTPVKYGLLEKKVPKKERDEVLQGSRVILATYGMFSKGVDVPRLSGGIDCTGRARAEQVHGRILRAKDGKLVPIWVTLRDIKSYRLDYQFGRRVADYVASSAEIYKWRIDKGVKRVDKDVLLAQVKRNVSNLKKMRTETHADGTYMLLMPKPENE